MLRVPIVAFVSFFFLSASAQQNPVANGEAVVQAGQARFTVLTPRVIRMEWDSAARFTDDATQVVINRNLPVPAFTRRQKGGWLIIETDHLEVQYRLQSGSFSAANLSVTYREGKKKLFTWKPGDKQTANLKGTAKTLDRYNGDSEEWKKTPLPVEDGLLARDGWTLIDDSSYLLDGSRWAWVKERRPRASKDWYFMGYARDYKKALHDFTLLAGKMPLPPRYAFGYWWSRYWNYSDNELRDLVKNFQRFNIPLDVLVIDMDWHETDSITARRDAFGQIQHWTGWTWNKSLFPDPEKFLAWTKSRQLKTTFNLHPASGIAPYEAPYGQMARRLKFDTTTRKNIPWKPTDKTFMKTFFDVVLRPMEKQGVDFWWLDWQQWPLDKQFKKLNNVWWLNHTFFTDMEQNRDTRPMLYHRWGGLGNHRYQIGFSGDAIISWKSLEYQPYFTNTASNLLYGYWSHDIGGHMFGAGPDSLKILHPELYVRWMQYGALSPIFRTHSAKDARLNKEIWNFRGDDYEALYDAIRLRYTLAPYIYTMARQAYDSGIALCRPLYYHYPDSPEAYDFSRQYMFGDDILVAPIGAPAVEGLSRVKVWLPAGADWYEWHTGTLLKGGQVVERDFTLTEYPIYVKSGGIIPMYGEGVQNLQETTNEWVLGLFPGGNYRTRVYEDGGDDKQYATQYAYTEVASEKRADGSLKVTLSPRKGAYAGMPDTRRVELRLYGSAMPEAVLVNGVPAAYATDPEPSTWNYAGKDLCVRIAVPELPATQAAEVEVRYPAGRSADLNGLVRKFNRLSKATTALKWKWGSRLPLPAIVAGTEATNLKLEYEPQNFYALIEQFHRDYEKIPEAIARTHLKKEVWQAYLRALGLPDPDGGKQAAATGGNKSVAPGAKTGRP